MRPHRVSAQAGDGKTQRAQGKQQEISGGVRPEDPTVGDAGVMTSDPTEQYSEGDDKFNAVHRAAWLGDLKLLTALFFGLQATLEDVSDSPSTSMDRQMQSLLNEIDSQGNTPAHIAALRGKHAALAFLVKMGADVDTVRNDEKTPFELLSLYETGGREDNSEEVLSEEEGQKVESREQQLWELHKNIEVTRIKHVLAAQYFDFRHFWFLFLPAAAVTGVSAGLSFMATATEDYGHLFSTIVGCLASLSVFIQTFSEQLQFRSRSAMHSSVALDLQSMVQDLTFQSIEAIECPKAKRIDVGNYQQKFQQVLQACKSPLPVAIEQTFNTIEDRLAESLRGWA
ncbi:hypothetical protein CYMTET_46125 [Cymbomonas tetramitiformis]|uniref:Uncharacterized protein n=1 Tax=Cymbomonas tetramitiformis TaxID=36881 RepID=A0AAE0EZ02_9CHLO|nr:hypothetical protein CYMTET_46125 [Cymbomonas tetramitiformis]